MGGGPDHADTSIHKLLKPNPGHTDPEAVFLGTVAPIELEDDNFHVICPTCYDFIAGAQYSSHRHSKGCHPPARPPESTGRSSRELCCQTPEKNQPVQSKLAGERIPTRKIEWPHAARPLVIQKIKQCDVRYWTAARDKMTAIYRAALRKANVDSTYNVNGQITSLQELKRQIWNLPRQLKTNI